MSDYITIKDYCLGALFTDGAHHKQWFIERVLEALGFDLEALRHEMKRANDYAWVPGIAP